MAKAYRIAQGAFTLYLAAVIYLFTYHTILAPVIAEQVQGTPQQQSR